MKKVEDIADSIRKASDAYYNGEPFMYDSDFDKMVDELMSKNPDHPVLSEVGAKIMVGKVKHKYRLGSLAKVKEDDLVAKYFEDKAPGQPIVCMPKMDGLTMSLTYLGGQLVQATTRGDGESGSDVTKNARAIANVPKHIDYHDPITVIGEVVIRKDDFQKLVDGGEKLSNPRNAASGTLGCDDVSLVEKRKLRFVAYRAEYKGKMSSSLSQDMVMLDEIDERFETVDWSVAECFADLSMFIDSWKEKRKDYPYQIDGLVFAVNNNKVFDGLGWSPDKHHPMGAIAWKFADVGVETTVRNLIYQIGRVGGLSIVLEIDPVEIGGSIVRRIGAGNHATVVEDGLAVGAKILACKSGDIIPIVKEVLEKAVPPKELLEKRMKCPVCSADIVFEERGAYCPNVSCPAKLEGRVLYWMEKHEMLGIGPETVHDLVEKGIVKKMFDIYNLSVEDWQKVCGSRETAEKLWHVVMAKYEMSFEKMLVALGMDGIGPSGASVIASAFKTLPELVKFLEAYDEKMNKFSIPGMTVAGEKRTIAVLIENLGNLKDGMSLLTIKEDKIVEGPLSGKKFCLTGTMSKERSEITKMIAAAGGQVVNSVNKSTTHLVQADVDSVSTKSQAAHKHGVKIISEISLYEMMEGK